MGPYMGDCGVARFFGGWKQEVVPVPHLSPFHHRKNPITVISKVKTKTRVQSFWFILKLSPLEPRQLLSGLCPHPGSSVLLLAVLMYPGSPLEPVFQVPVTARPSWLLWREHANKWGQHVFLSKRESFFVKLGYIIMGLVGPGALSK